MFAVFAATMHLKFTAAFPTPEAVAVAKIVWQRGLVDLTDDEIQAGLAAMANRPMEMFPSLSEFKIAICPRFGTHNVQIGRAKFVAAHPDTAKAAWETLAKQTNLNTKLKIALNKIIERNNAKKD